MTCERQGVRRHAALLAVLALAGSSLASFGAWAQYAGDDLDPKGDVAFEASSLDGAESEAMAITPKDTTSNTDDKSVGVPTGWWTYTNVSASQVNSYLSTNNARLTDLEIYSVTSGVPRFTVTMVANTGSYAVPGWWWYYGQTFAQVGSLLNSNSARLIRLAPYDSGGGVQKFAVVMVSNTGATARGWTYLSGATPTDITNNINNNNQRLIDLDTYGSGTALRYSAVFVTNSGADAKSWQWWYNQTPAQVSSRISAFGGRLVHINREPNGNFDIILVKNTGGDAFYWHWQYGLGSAADAVAYANQQGERITDLATYTSGGVRKYAAVYIDNSNTATGRIRSLFAPTFLDANGNPTRGVFQAYLKRAGSSVLIDLNGNAPIEVASSLKALHLAHTMKQIQNGVDTRASSFTYYQYPNSPFNAGTKDACPITTDETAGNARTNYNLGKGLDEMMSISDNRTTRGVLLRYGRTAIQGTATAIGMSNTTLRSNGNHNNLGCYYYNVETGEWTELGNATTAADLAKLYESVYQSTWITGTPRTDFLNSANPSSGAGSALQAIINAEATSLGKSSTVAAEFGAAWRSYGKGGSYSGELSNGQKVRVLSGAGIVRIPIKSRGVLAYRNYVFGRLYSKTPVGTGYPAESTYQNVYNKVAVELYREEIRSALQTW